MDVGSPFDYPRQGILYVAKHLSRPARDGDRDGHAGRAHRADPGGRRPHARPVLLDAGGPARGGGAALRIPEYPILLQGEETLGELIKSFAADPRTCLFGTLSLWQGVDVPGPSCQLVVMDKIPFPRPDDPLMSARQKAVEEAGGNGFMAVAATHAALLMAQGAGRLVRAPGDRGVVAVLDQRLATARYGSYLKASLPDFWYTTDRNQVRRSLAAIDSAAKDRRKRRRRRRRERPVACPDRPGRPPAVAHGLSARTVLRRVLDSTGPRNRRSGSRGPVRGGDGHGRRPPRVSHAAQHGHHLAEDGRVVTGDRLVGGVVREQPHMAVLALEALDRGLAVQHGGHDVAVLGDRLAADRHPVAVADGGLDHRVADDLQDEQLAVADQLAGEREHVLDRLLGEDRATGGDPAHERARTTRRACRRCPWAAPSDWSEPRTSYARGRCGSRRRKPLRSSAISWCATEEVLDRPTAWPISRIDGGYPRRCTESLMTSMTRRCRSVSPELSARMPGGRPGRERLGPSWFVASFIACTGSSRPWERSWAVMVALSAVVVTSAPLDGLPAGQR